jgi:hypothetical protein
MQQIRLVSFGDDEAADPGRVEDAVREFRPRWTPSPKPCA